MLCGPIYFGERDHDNQCNQASRSLIVPLPAAQSAPIPIPRRARPTGHSHARTTGNLAQRFKDVERRAALQRKEVESAANR